MDMCALCVPVQLPKSIRKSLDGVLVWIVVRYGWHGWYGLGGLDGRVEHTVRLQKAEGCNALHCSTQQQHRTTQEKSQKRMVRRPQRRLDCRENGWCGGQVDVWAGRVWGEREQ